MMRPFELGTPLFRDRFDAGSELARVLSLPEGERPVVVGLARGGVQVATEIARSLGAPLDVVAVRKVGHPLEPEYAIGAVTPGGGTYVRTREGLPEEDVAAALEAAQRSAEELDRRLHSRRPAAELEGRTAVLVDDGLATGATMIAAARWARAQGAGRVVAAVPVASESSAERLRAEVDELVCPHILEAFGAVGFFYERFDQIGDEEVLALLDAAAGASAD